MQRIINVHQFQTKILCNICYSKFVKLLFFVLKYVTSSFPSLIDHQTSTLGIFSMKKLAPGDGHERLTCVQFTFCIQKGVHFWIFLCVYFCFFASCLFALSLILFLFAVLYHTYIHTYIHMKIMKIKIMKIMKGALYFTWKALFVLKIFLARKQ